MSKKIPNAIMTEKLLLGAILFDDDAFEEISMMLKPAHFYDRKHQQIFEIFYALKQSNLMIDAVTVFEQLRKQNADVTPSYLAELAEGSPSSAALKQYAAIIYEKYLLRELIEVAYKTANRSYREDDPFEVLEKAKNEFEHLTDDLNFLQAEKNLGDELLKIYEQLEIEQTEGNKKSYETKNFPTFNRATQGILPGEMVVVSGRPKGGKTTFGLGLILDFFEQYREPVALFTYEMPFDQYAKKNISIATGTRYEYLRNPGKKNKSGSLQFDRVKMSRSLHSALKVFKDGKFFIIDEVLNEQQLASKIRYLNRKQNVETILIDYISLIEVVKKRERRDLDIAEISRMLKRLTNELKLRTIVLSQENKEGKTAESTALEKDCDFWFSISKPINDDKETVKIGKHSLKVDHSLFVVDYRNSRHSGNGGKFITYYMRNGQFKEIDPEHYIPNVGIKDQTELPVPDFGNEGDN